MFRLVFFVFILGMVPARCLDFSRSPSNNPLTWDLKTPPSENLTPKEAMVELTNKLGITVLQHYSYSKLNFAFSPYGLASTLVVLYEGAEGESAKQIREGVNFPLNRETMRTGFRDLHKRLESYLGQDEFSNGIAFNKKNTKLKPKYKDILKFYGFKFDSNDYLHEDDENEDIKPSKPENTLNECPENSKKMQEGKMVCDTKEEETVTVTEETGGSGTTISPSRITTEGPVTTEKKPVREEEFDSNLVTATEETVTVTNKNNEKDEDSGTTIASSIPTSEKKPVRQEEFDSNSAAATEETVTVSDTENKEDMSFVMTTPEENETETSPNSIIQGESEEETEDEKELLDPRRRGDSRPHGRQETKMSARNTEIVMEMLNKNDENWSNHVKKMLELYGQERDTRSIDDLIERNHPKPTAPLGFKKYFSNSSNNSDANGGMLMHLFLSYGVVDIPVPMMTFTDTFPFGYIPKLHAKALELPLDDPRYKFLIVLPLERRGLRQLVFNLDGNSVKDILKTMKPTRVRTMVPPFVEDNFVYLSSGVKLLGIQDVFDPHKANLSGMSFDPELYVENIEQSVTVVIKDYGKTSDAQGHTMEASEFDHVFSATHPFLYFILDSELNVALMIGQMFNPTYRR